MNATMAKFINYKWRRIIGLTASCTMFEFGRVAFTVGAVLAMDVEPYGGVRIYIKLCWGTVGVVYCRAVHEAPHVARMALARIGYGGDHSIVRLSIWVGILFDDLHQVRWQRRNVSRYQVHFFVYPSGGYLLYLNQIKKWRRQGRGQGHLPLDDAVVN